MEMLIKILIAIIGGVLVNCLKNKIDVIWIYILGFHLIL
jgi:hypothetical protein